MTAPAIRCESLVKCYGDKLAVAGIELKVEVGECFGLLGPNGAGKTTTVEMLEGLTRPDSGTVELFGVRWGTGSDREIQERLGVQLQDTQLADKLTVEEVLRLFRSFYRQGRSVEQLITELDLSAERKQQYHKLSGGQKQRVALGTALAGDPELLFLDEPTTGLDPRARQTLWGIVQRFQSRGRSVLITTHYMEEAAALCDRIAIMDHGKIIALGTPRSLVDGLGLVQFVEFETKQALDEAAVAALGPVESIERRGEGYRLRIDRSLSALGAVLAELERQKVTPIGLSTHQATLDDVFLHLTGRALKTDEAGQTTAGAA
ncbi:MAG TPA: ABC transporter ATP-binding protein [Polyangiaceae bacterium]|nr:ABC transporter ATP-binding protein [Polyangiaceae bacterium]